MRARVALSFIKDNDTAIAHFREQRAKGPLAVPAQYALVLALTRSGGWAKLELLAPCVSLHQTTLPQNCGSRYRYQGRKVRRRDRTAAKGLSPPDNHP